MKRTVPVFLFAVLVAVFVGWTPNVHAFSNYFTDVAQGNCAVCHVGQTGNTFCGMCHAHGVHSSSAKNDINVSGTTDKATYAPGETVNVTVAGGYRATAARAILYDQDSVLLDISTGTGFPPVNAAVWPVTLSGTAPTTPGTYIWSVAWYGHEFDAGGATFGNGSNGSLWTPDGGNANHGWETVSIASFDVVSAPGTPAIAIAPPGFDFGDVTVGNTSAVEVTISNTGTADLALTDGVLSDETNFSIDLNGGTNPCGDPVPPIAAGDNCTVSVAFMPQSPAAFSATITVTSNDPINSPLDVPLTGNGVLVPTPNIAVAPASVDFGEVNVGDSPATEVTLSNTGSADLVVSGIALDNTAVYSLDETGGGNPCGTLTPTIVAGDNCTVDVIFTPAADGGPFNANVTIDSNDPDTPSAVVPVTGTGFLDTDGDGVGDSVDDFPADNTKASPLAATGTGKITVDAGTNALSMVAAVAEGDVNQTGKPSGFTFPDGLVTFQVAVAAPGDNAVVTISFPSGQPSGGKYYKVGSGGFAEFAGATINTDNVVLMLTDGGSGDNDNTADAVINDPGGLAVPVPVSSSSGGGGCSVIGSGGAGGSSAVIFLTLLAILVALRRQRVRAGR